MIVFLGCSEDDETPPLQAPRYTLIKIEKEFRFFEDQGPQEIIIPFVSNAYSDGEFKLSLHTEDEINFETIPEMLNGVISFKVKKGDANAVLIVTPQNDESINGYHDYSFTLTALSEYFRRANENNLEIGIYDDELNGMPRNFESSSKSSELSIEFFYNSDKKLHKTNQLYSDDWFDLNEVIKYYYDDEKKLIKTKHSLGLDDANPQQVHEIIYIWENDLVVQTNYMAGEIKQYYTVYEYDAHHNVSMAEEYYVQSPLEEPILTYRTIYSYDGNDNLTEKHITTYYHPNEWDSQDDETLSKITYGEYVEYEGTFPVNEIIPGVIYQKNLPGFMKVEEEGALAVISNYSYEFNVEGKLTKRTTDDETAVFNYQ